MKHVLLFSSILVAAFVQGQQGYKVNDITGDFPINKIINYQESSSSFQQLKKKMVIVDFFGTWCVPCVKALPKLAALQRAYPDQLIILLVSEEPLEKLQAFIKRQSDFIFPVVVDEKKEFVARFQPPSYPYTVVVGKNDKIISLPIPEEITEKNIIRWLEEQQIKTGAVVNMPVKTDSLQVSSTNNKSEEVEPSQNKLVQLSQAFMYAAKTGDETAGFISQLQQISMIDLQSAIKTDEEKKAFWINLYNAYTQVSLKKNPDQYKNRKQFFTGKQLEISGKRFSLDDIEHGILRRSKIKWSLGYFSKLFPNKTEKKLRVKKLDYRLHFALNCGAKSCPPIAFYKPENINQQLDLATKAYLRSESTYDEGANTVKLPTLMSWFRRDFGGKAAMIRLLKELEIVPQNKNPKILFNRYDWTLYLENYK